MKVLALIAGLALTTTVSHAATYIYQTGALSGPTGTPPSDTFQLQFTSPFQLEPNSVYDVAVVADSIDHIVTWSAADERWGAFLTGSGETIVKVAYPGILGGGTLGWCDGSRTCFGGGLATDTTGAIVSWNLVADPAWADPFQTFISYNTPFLGGTADVLVVGAEGVASHVPGNWTCLDCTPFTLPVPEPASNALLFVGCAVVFGARFFGSARKMCSDVPA